MLELERFLERLVNREIGEAAALEYFNARTEAEKTFLVERLETAKSGAPGAAAPRRRLAVRTNHTCTDDQRRFLQTFVDRYAAKTARSKAEAARHRGTLADQRTPAYFNPLLKEIQYPLTLTEATGPRLRDIDGNSYLDIAGDFGVNLFGHAPAFLNHALKSQLDAGISLSGRYGALTEAAELFCELTGHQRVVFCQSGTEALISALRLARAFTERQKVAVFNYAYHGHADVFLNEFTPGVSEAALTDAIALDYGSDEALARIEAIAGDLAAVIVEPVQSEQLALQPAAFLRRLREITARAGVVLVFDEMITGFRIDPRGCQGMFGIDADLATYGKILGGGLPAGAVGGRADIMDWVDGGDWRYGDSSKPKPATYIAGTHTQNPLKMAATTAILRELKRTSPGLQQRLTAQTQRLTAEVNAFAEAHGLPFEVVSFGSQFRLRFQTAQFTITQALFLHVLNDLGVRYHMHGNCFLTAAHSDADVAEISRALQEALQLLLQQGFFYEPAGAIEASDEAARPRGRGGARLVSVQPAAPLAAPPVAAHEPVDSAWLNISVEQFAESVKLVIAEFLELSPDEISDDEELGHLGLDSILFVKILKILSAELGRKLSLKAFAEVRTVAELAQRIWLELRAPTAATDEDEGELPEGAGPSRSAAAAPSAIAIASPPSARPQDIAIIGMSGVFPGADDIDGFWRNLMEGHCAIREVPPDRWAWRDVYSPEPASGKTSSKWGGFVEGHDLFDPLFFRISPREAKYMDPQERLLLMQSYRALEDSGLNPGELAGSRVGVFIGYEFADYARRIETLRAHLPESESDLFDASARPYYLANRISFTFDFKGPSEAVNLNCASSAVAVNRACQSLRAGESEVALVGGVCLNLVPDGFLQAGELLSHDGTCRVFGERANGYVKGEACVVQVLKRLDHALRDGDPIYAVVKDCAVNNRGRGASLSEVRSEPLQEVIADCHRRAGVDPGSVRYIEVDGYSTRVGDWLEFEAIKAALADSGGKTCALGSLKPNLGNLEPASGVAGVAKVALALSHQVFPPTIGVEQVNSLLDVTSDGHPLRLAIEAIPFETLTGDQPVRAGVNSFADSGVNVHVLLEAPPVRRSPPTSGPGVFVISARSAPVLDAYLGSWVAWLKRHPEVDLGRLCYSVQLGREAFNHRLACTADSVAELVAGLEAAQQGAAWPGLSRAVAERRDVAGAVVVRPHPASDAAQDLVRRWTAGEEIDWRAFYPAGRPTPLSMLPTYPFAKKRCWIDAVATEAVPPAALAPPVAQEPPESLLRPEPVVAGTPAIPPAPAIEPARPVGLADTMQRIRQIIEAFLELSTDDELDEFASFADMGLTSLAIVEFVDEINRQFDLALPETTAFDYPTLPELAKHVAALGAIRSADAPANRPARPVHATEPV